MVTATWNGTVVARSEDTVVVDGNHYFPREALDPAVFEDSAKTSVCSWKGTAHYLNIVVNGETNRDAAWYYTDPKPAAEQIAGRVAFWGGVIVS